MEVAFSFNQLAEEFLGSLYKYIVQLFWLEVDIRASMKFAL